jgi:hypothetical protein
MAGWLVLPGPATAETRAPIDLKDSKFDAYWLSVSISVDPMAGTFEGQYDDELGTMGFALSLNPLTGAKNALTGYIDASGALVPLDKEWLPKLSDHQLGWRFVVQTPPGYLAVPFPGGKVELTSDGGISTFFLSSNLAPAPLVVGKFELKERQANGVTLRTFFTKQNARLADSYLDASGEAIASFSDRIGAYPYEAFSVVESPLPVGIGYPGYTLVSGRILPLPFMRGRSLWHEIAHVWWGNGVFVDYENGNWAEGFAAFFADYALADAAGKGREHRYDWLLEYDALPSSGDYPLRQFVTKSHGQSPAIGYGKAAMLLVMLREKIGATAFDAGIKRFWQANQFKAAGWTDIEAAFQAESDQPLAPFFKRWLDKHGALPANAADRNFLTFRNLAANERLQTLRSLSNAKSIAVEALSGAAPMPDIGKPQAANGLPVLVGSRAALKARVARMPPPGAAAIWATQDRDGRDVIAVHAPNSEAMRGLVTRARHYGKWSWLVVQESGRPQRGRWPIGG